MQRRYHTEELQHFLRLIDAELVHPCTLALVGEAALSLGYCPANSAVGIDIWTASDNVFWTAAERASEKIPRPIRVAQALAGEPRYTFEDRLWQVPIDGLRFLTVLVPEAHDQVLLNAARAAPLESIGALHRDHPLSLGVLVERYHEMKGQVSGPKSRFKACFLAELANLFGEERAAEVGRRLRS